MGSAAATRSVFAGSLTAGTGSGCAVVIAGAGGLAGSAGAAITAGEVGFSAAGSTLNVASIGSIVSGGWAKAVSGAARQDELLANDSWAARSSAAAPSPKTRSDIDSMIAANRKRKPGSMARGKLAKTSGQERGGH
ncbi:MAG: hypothetical protein KGI34_25265 [Bradyrhizobium sp.]|nr:hypothetical protein [Bradyrhizobium sp.]